MKVIRRASEATALYTTLLASVTNTVWAIDPASVFAIPDTLEIQVFASEPQVVDPVALCFDESNRCYVVEMRDYPLGIGPDRIPGGTIRLLEDTDGDGRVDRSTVFAEGLSYPTSITPYNGGVFVSAPPEILYFKDTDGDRRADVRRTVLRGFTLGVTDSNVNGLRWGLDNRIHGANGGNGGEIFSADRPNTKLSIRDLDFSFSPVDVQITTTFATGGGFGLVFDDWGRRFTTYNINHILHQSVAHRYLKNSRGLPSFDPSSSISDHGEMARIYPIASAQTRVNHPEQAGHFSSAGGLGHIGVRGWPGDLSGSVLVCDAVSHIVHRDVILEQGSGFVATRSPSEQHSEFIASRDTACRPVGLELGPDSALYLIDMQRDVIEHPDYIPEKVKERMNLRAGENRGRIYRIAPKGQSKQRVMLAGLSDTERVSLLGHSNQWVRVTAQRLLVESGRTQIAAQLRERLRDQANPLGQLHALWTLQGLELLTWEDLDKLLGSNEPGLVENALVASETRELWRSEAVSRARELCASSHPRVRFQAALTLGVLSDARDVDRLGALRNVWMRDWQYPLSRVAVIIGLPDRANTLLADFLKSHRAPSTNSALRDAIKDLGFSAGRQRTAESDRSLAEVLREASKPGFPAELARTVLESIHSGLSSQPPQATAEEASILEAMERSLSENSRPALWRLCNKLKLPTSSIQKSAIAEAIRRAADRSLATSLRVEAIDVLRLGDGVSTRPVLFGLMDSREPARLQSVAWEQLKSSSEEAVAQEILARWKGISPSLRPSIVNSLVYRKSWNGSLLQSLEEGRLTAGELNLDLEQRRQLLRHAGETNKVRASKFFGDEEYSNRKTVVSDWLARLPSKGDASKGRVVFEKLCASCHQSNGKGHAVGPDLTRQSHRSVEDLASNILDPNMALNPSFAAVTVEQKDGETVVGILESEDSEHVVLKQAQGIRVNVSRAEISGLTYTSRSLMPEGLESGLSPQELRDLIAYIQE